MFVTEADYSPIGPTGKGLSDPPRYRISETWLGIWRVRASDQIKT